VAPNSGATDNEVTLGEIVRRLDSLHDELRHQSGTFVRSELYESQRQDNGRRIGDVEKDVTEVRTAFDSFKLETERRYRTTVNLFIGGFISLLGGGFLLVLQVVSK
jgi:hypothetical protein